MYPQVQTKDSLNEVNRGLPPIPADTALMLFGNKLKAKRIIFFLQETKLFTKCTKYKNAYSFHKVHWSSEFRDSKSHQSFVLNFLILLLFIALTEKEAH